MATPIGGIISIISKDWTITKAWRQSRFYRRSALSPSFICP